MGSNSFYDGNKLLNMLDLDKKKPAIYMICGNRTAGKTFWCKNYMLKKFLESGRKFIVLVRFGYQLNGMAETYFKDLKEVKYPDMEMTEAVEVQNSIHKLFLNGEPCGYSVAINNADSVKRNSTLFVDVDYMFLDEFQSETNKYCPDEIQKFVSIYTSVARGGGQHMRDVKCLLASNTVSLLNPYFNEFGIGYRVQENTRFMRGKGWILEFTYNENASNAIKNSAFGRAFSEHKYMKFSTENDFLNDSNVFIEKPEGNGKLLCVMDYGGKSFGLWEYPLFLYMSEKFDPNFPVRYSLTVGDHKENLTLLKRSDNVLQWYRFCFDQGRVRFQNLKCKEVMFNLLGFTKSTNAY